MGLAVSGRAKAGETRKKTDAGRVHKFNGTTKLVQSQKRTCESRQEEGHQLRTDEVAAPWTEVRVVARGLGEARSVWLQRRKGVERTVATASGSATRVDGDAKLEFVRGAQHESLNPDVKRPVAPCAIVSKGNRVVSGSTESYIGHVAMWRRLFMLETWSVESCNGTRDTKHEAVAP